MIISVCLVVTPVCRGLPRPPGGAVEWTLLFGDAGLDCGASPTSPYECVGLGFDQSQCWSKEAGMLSCHLLSGHIRRGQW